MGRKKLILSLVGLAILIIGVPIGIFLVGQSQEIREKAAPATSVSITPSSKTVQVDETFTLNVAVDTAENTISAAEIHLSFDPTLLEAQSISAGSFLTVTILPGTVNNTTGRATITLGAQPTEPKKGTGTLAVRLRFQYT